jgi:hypothetical protein
MTSFSGQEEKGVLGEVEGTSKMGKYSLVGKRIDSILVRRLY